MKTLNRLFVLVLLSALLLASCGAGGTVGDLRSESQSVELGDADAVRVEIVLGAGNLELAGGAEQLLEADFTYNVDKLRPEVTYGSGKLAVRQPDSRGFSDPTGITGFRNEWVLRLHDQTPMVMRLDVGGGSGDLKLSDLALTELDASFGAGDYLIDLSGDWEQDLRAAIDAGAANIRLRLPSEVGARVAVDTGPAAVTARGLTKEGNVYTNAAYGESPVTLTIDLDIGVGLVTLEAEDS